MREDLHDEERAVLRLVAQGLDNHEIAVALGQPEHTVANRLRVVFRKIHVTNRTQAALYALRHGLASLDDPKI
jgi:NarL family two-component system response regulator LiaR